MGGAAAPGAPLLSASKEEAGLPCQVGGWVGELLAAPSGKGVVLAGVGQQQQPTSHCNFSGGGVAQEGSFAPPWGLSSSFAPWCPCFVSDLKNRFPPVLQITAAACGYGFTLLSSRTADVTKVWGMGLNKDSQIGFHQSNKNRCKSLVSASCSDF